MKTNRFIIFFIVLTLFSCSSKQPSENNDVPKALKNESLSINVLSKRHYDDLLEKLYEELAKNTPELNELELKIKALKESEVDSTEKFIDYDGKNQRYYGSAKGKVTEIRDSVLRERIRLMIENSASKYDKSIVKQTALLKQIGVKKMSLNDLHITLKIMKTLPLIEQYQATSKPSNHSLNGYFKEINKTIILADKLVEK